MPLEVEIYRGNPTSSLYKKLQQFLDSEEYDRDSDSLQPNKKSSSSNLGVKRTLSSTPLDSDDDSTSSFSALAAKTVYWYRGADKFLKRELAKIVRNANENGRIDAKDLNEEGLELLQLYMDHQVSQRLMTVS